MFHIRGDDERAGMDKSEDEDDDALPSSPSPRHQDGCGCSPTGWRRRRPGPGSSTASCGGHLSSACRILPGGGGGVEERKVGEGWAEEKRGMERRKGERRREKRGGKKRGGDETPVNGNRCSSERKKDKAIINQNKL